MEMPLVSVNAIQSHGINHVQDDDHTQHPLSYTIDVRRM